MTFLKEFYIWCEIFIRNENEDKSASTMPLGRVYIPPPTTPIKYGSEFGFPNQQNLGNNKFSNKFNHINNDPDEEDDFLIRTNNLKNKLNNETTSTKPLSFNYNVDINGAHDDQDRPNSQNSGKGQAFRKIEIKILDTKYYDNEENPEIKTLKESDICNGNGNLFNRSVIGVNVNSERIA